MTYSFNFVLKKTAHSEWSVFSDKGFELMKFSRCSNSTEALERCRAWASSWNSVNIVVEHETNQEKINKTSNQ
jgi:hypothetical protein